MKESATEPRVIAQYKDEPSRMEGRFTLDELLEACQELLPLEKVFVQKVSDDGTIVLEHLCNLVVSVSHPTDASATLSSPSSSTEEPQNSIVPPQEAPQFNIMEGGGIPSEEGEHLNTGHPHASEKKSKIRQLFSK